MFQECVQPPKLSLEHYSTWHLKSQTKVNVGTEPQPTSGHSVAPWLRWQRANLHSQNWDLLKQHSSRLDTTRRIRRFRKSFRTEPATLFSGALNPIPTTELPLSSCLKIRFQVSSLSNCCNPRKSQRIEKISKSRTLILNHEDQNGCGRIFFKDISHLFSRRCHLLSPKLENLHHKNVKILQYLQAWTAILIVTLVDFECSFFYMFIFQVNARRVYASTPSSTGASPCRQIAHCPVFQAIQVHPTKHQLVPKSSEYFVFKVSFLLHHAH